MRRDAAERTGLQLLRLEHLLEKSWLDTRPLRTRFLSARPFPHLVIPGLVRPDHAVAAAESFPSDLDERWTSYLHYNERKYGMTHLSAFPQALRALAETFCSDTFVGWLEKITGIEGLLADPSLEGGGLHATRRGGFLRLHADFTGHHHRPTWQRRLNLILFLNPIWQEAWRGQLELWSRDLEKCHARIDPLLNHAVLFATDETSFHGYPDPLDCPPEVVRRSLALYYYTENADYRRRATDYRARPSERSRAKWIWLDKKALAAYTWCKQRFGLSDRLVSRLLRRFFR